MKKYYIKTGAGAYFCAPNQGADFDIKKAYKYTKEEANLLLEKLSITESRNIYTLELAGKQKILILGDARHGKDTFAKILEELFGFNFVGSSEMALNVFLYDTLIEKYKLPYTTKEEAFKDRVNHRDKWFNEITEFNRGDKLRLVKCILEEADIYVGLRSDVEVEAAIEKGMFDYIIGIYDYRKGRESIKSNTANVLRYSDIILTNNGTIDQLREKTLKYLKNVL